jgi:hypothetical protein
MAPPKPKGLKKGTNCDMQQKIKNRGKGGKEFKKADVDSLIP